MWRNRARSLLDVTKVRFASLIERCGNADQYGVPVAQAGKIRCGRKAMPFYVRANPLTWDVLNVGLSGIQLFNLGWVRIEPQDRVPLICESQGQRQPDVAATDDAHPYIFTG